MKQPFPQLEKKIGYSFQRKDLLLHALTHSSYAYENQQEEKADNEVLEFLGDSVVGLAVADFFYSTYPHLSEGELSKFKSIAASTSSLSQFAKKIKVQRYILLGKGEEKSRGREKRTILAGAFEALAGAIYLDGGFEEAKNFLFQFLKDSFNKIGSKKFFIDNYKSALQEHFQKANLPPPAYRTITSLGPDHEKSFVVEVYSENETLAKARGYSKKNAEQKAAQKALRSLLGKKMRTLTLDTFILKK